MPLDDLRDSLIADLDGAIKFQPMLEKMAAEELAKIPLVDVKGKTPDELQAMVEKAVEGRRDEALAIAQQENQAFIDNLRAEIRNDPDKRGYSGMTPEQICEEMSRELPITENQEGPSPREQFVDTLLAQIKAKYPGFIVLKDGTTILNEQVQGWINLAAQGAGNPSADPSVVEVVTGYRPAPVWRVITGIMFSRNVIRVEEIAEAMQ